MPEDPGRYGPLLRRLRLAAGLTQATLGERAGLSERAIQELERGAARPRRDTTRRLVAALAPSSEERALLEAVTPSPRPRRPIPASDQARAPAAKPVESVEAPPNNLPVERSALIGREQEREAVGLLVRRENVGLVTLTGPGGVGKTRLGLQVASDLVAAFPDGVYLIELAPILDPALVPGTIAQMLGIRDDGGRTLVEALGDYLRRKRLLLVLDNFEQVVSAAPVIGDLVATCPGLTVLVTSREPLRLRMEHEYAVPPLGLPAPREMQAVAEVSQSPAVALFVQRATAIRSDFGLTAENGAAIAEICLRLDGLPLAIELAAARVRLLTPEAMVQRLERRLPLLTGGPRGVAARQQTLRATIDWSFDLLDEDERRLLRRLSVFAGGFTLVAAEAVGGDDDPREPSVLDGLESLIAQSLVRRLDGPHAEPRFGMLETIREYAQERLEASGEAEEARQRQATFCLDLAERAATGAYGHAQVAWLARLESEHDNMRAALRWLAERGDAVSGLRLSTGLWRFWQVRGHHAEGLDRLAHLLAQGEREPAEAPTYPPQRAAALDGLGTLLMHQGDYAAARAAHKEALIVCQRCGDERGIARSLNGLGWVAIQEGDVVTARDLHELSLAITRRLGDQWGSANSLSGLGWIAIVQDNPARARILLDESLAIARHLGDQRGITNSLIHLGCLALAQGDHQLARDYVNEGLATSQEMGDKSMIAEALEVLAKVALTAREIHRAARLLGAAHALREAIGAPLPPSDHAEHEDDVRAVRTILGDRAFATLWGMGQTMDPEQAIACAFEGSESR